MGKVIVDVSPSVDGLVDEVRLHVVTILLGGGTALFDQSPRYELEQIGTEATPQAVRLTYAVRR